MITLSDNGSCFDNIWQDGEAIDTKEYDLSRLEFICENRPRNGMTDFAISDMGCPVVSHGLKDALDKHGINNIDYYPATVIERKGTEPEPGFYAANILGLESCIDTDKSEFRGASKDGEVTGILGISHLVLKSPSPGAGDIYRARLFRRLIIVSGKALELFNEKSFSGVKFIEPEKWDGFAGEKA